MSPQEFSTRITIIDNVVDLPIGAVAVGVILPFLRINRGNNPGDLTLRDRISKLDFIGAAILIPTIVCLLLALQWAGSAYAWNSARIIGLFIGFASLAIVFTGSQLWLGNAGTFPPRILGNRDVVLALAFAFSFGSAFFSLIFYIAIYYQSVKGYVSMET